MAGQRIAVVGQIILATISKVEPTDDGYRIIASQEHLLGAGKVANELNSAGAITLLVGVVSEDDVATVKRMARGYSYIMGDTSPTLRQEFIGLELRIDRGERPTLSKADAARMASQIQQFRPDEIRLVDCDDEVLAAICSAGMGGLLYRDEMAGREAS